MDLGTANTVILVDNKVVVDEPSIVAFDQTTGKPIAFGQKARLMHEKTHPNIKTVRPLRDGVIADFNAAEQMIRGLRICQDDQLQALILHPEPQDGDMYPQRKH